MTTEVETIENKESERKISTDDFETLKGGLFAIANYYKQLGLNVHTIFKNIMKSSFIDSVVDVFTSIHGLVQKGMGIESVFKEQNKRIIEKYGVNPNESINIDNGEIVLTKTPQRQ